MSDLLIGAIVALFFALLSLRPIDSTARTCGDLRERARRAGWAACLLGTLRVVLVVCLLVLNDVCRICLHLFEGVRVLLGALAAAAMHSSSRIALGGTP